MKYAYLISAYKDPMHLARLVESLGREADFFIHVDKKVDIIPFEQALYRRTNVLFISDRVSVSWGGFSQVLAITSMMKAAFESKIRYDRILNITGMDYPIWSKQRLDEEFTQYPIKEYIMGFNITDTSSKVQKNKIRKYWFFDNWIRNNFANKVVRKIANMVSTYMPLSKSLQVRIDDDRNCDVYFGSDYWALTWDCAKLVYDTFMKAQDFQVYFRYSFAPSELFTQTIIFNSVFRKFAMLYLVQNFPVFQNLHHCTTLTTEKRLRCLMNTTTRNWYKVEKCFSVRLLARNQESCSTKLIC